MKSLLKNLILTLIITLMAVAIVSAGDFTGNFSIDTVDAYPGEPVGIPVYLSNNNVDFATLFLPIRYDSDVMTYDSVSFEGSLMPDDFSGLPFDFSSRELIQITYLPPFGASIPSISTTGGLIGTIWFTLSDQAGPGFVPIDSASIDSMSIYGIDTTLGWIGAIMANSTGTTTWFPDCLSGGINILIPTSIVDETNGSLPAAFDLAQNYPNPFNPATVIEFSLAEAGNVKLEIYNVIGQKILTLVESSKPAGYHQVEFNASAYPSGIFFYRLSQGDKTQTKKMVLIK